MDRGGVSLSMESDGLVDNDILQGNPGAAGDNRPRLELREDAFNSSGSHSQSTLEEDDDGWNLDGRGGPGVPNRMGNTAPRPTSMEEAAPGGMIGGAQGVVEQEMTEARAAAADTMAREGLRGAGSGSAASSRPHAHNGATAAGDPEDPRQTAPHFHWESNYKEAAIFLDEGLNNQKFTYHPRSCEDLPAYLMVHNAWFHLIDLAASLVLLALGFVERPCKPPLCVPTQVHSSIELCILLLIGFQVFLRMR